MPALTRVGILYLNSKIQLQHFFANIPPVEAAFKPNIRRSGIGLIQRHSQRVAGCGDAEHPPAVAFEYAVFKRRARVVDRRTRSAAPPVQPMDGITLLIGRRVSAACDNHASRGAAVLADRDPGSPTYGSRLVYL